MGLLNDNLWSDILLFLLSCKQQVDWQLNVYVDFHTLNIVIACNLRLDHKKLGSKTDHYEGFIFE